MSCLLRHIFLCLLRFNLDWFGLAFENWFPNFVRNIASLGFLVTSFEWFVLRFFLKFSQLPKSLIHLNLSFNCSIKIFIKYGLIKIVPVLHYFWKQVFRFLFVPEQQVFENLKCLFLRYKYFQSCIQNFLEHK